LARASLREGRRLRRKASLRLRKILCSYCLRKLGRNLCLYRKGYTAVLKSSVQPERDKRWLFEEIILAYYVYILQSLKTKKLYIGHTDNLARRLREHNTGRGGRYTRQNGPWELVYYSGPYPDRASAAKWERYLKSARGSQEKKKLAGVLR